jgi:hypothetical protein
MHSVNLRAERKICYYLRDLLAPISIGSEIDESDKFRGFQTGLEYFIPSLLRQTYSFWDRESLDAFRFAVFHKVGELEAEFIGLCLLITDQVWIPFYLRLSIYDCKNSVKWLECKLGEVCDDGMLVVFYNSTNETKFIYSVRNRIEKISWAFTTKYGAAIQS